MTPRCVLFAATMLAVPLAAAAQPVAGPYVSLGAGVDFLQDETLKLAPQLGVRDRWVYFNSGFSGQASFGWGFGDGLRAEIEGNYSSNHVDGVSYPDVGRAGGTERQYGGFLNVLYDLDVHLPVRPYFGVGAGGQELGDNNINFGSPGFQSSRRGTYQTAGAFAYQAIAGFSVPAPWLRGLAFTADYRLIGLVDPLEAVHYERFPANSPANAFLGLPAQRPAFGNGKFGNVFNHEIQIGLRYAFGPAPAPLATPAIIAPPAPAPARTYLVFFDWDRADLTEHARQIVAEAAQASTRVQTTRIEVDGYTDSSGTARYNQALSLRRAESVSAELVHDGVARNDIAVQGFGETHPLVATADGVREPQNRRVEIILR